MPHRSLDPAEVDPRARYELLTSLVVPRPIGWISTVGADGVLNLAPYSYFGAFAASPMVVGVSVGHRAGGPKDTLVNIRTRRAFCVNIVDVAHLEAMNATSAEVPPATDEFALAGLEAATSERVDAPYVRSAPAVLECRVMQEVALGDAPNTLVLGEVVGVLVSESLPFLEGRYVVDTEALKPVGRLWGAAYALPGEVRILPRP